MRIKFAVLLQCILLLCTQSVSAVNIEMVTVGNPGNAPDMRYRYNGSVGLGAVNYVYQIGKYEITAGQYTEFLNAVAKSDPHGLYDAEMSDPVIPSLGANIQRSGSAPNFIYTVEPDWADRPVNRISFWDAARFANWLHNGQPIGPQGPGTTEEGAYHDIDDGRLFGRNPNAKFFIPTYEEWYKAAYHDKSAGLAEKYFDYPTGTNAVPGNDITEGTNPGNNANYIVGNLASNYAIGSPYYRTAVGEFELSHSPYGTFDQGGNVAELNEKAVDSNGWSHLMPGGSFYSSSAAIKGGSNTAPFFFEGNSDMGFRIAAPAPIPEPTSLTLFSLTALMLGTGRYKTRRS